MLGWECLHDLNQSGWWSVLIFVPVLSFILYLYLMFFKGGEKRNSYLWFSSRNPIMGRYLWRNCGVTTHYFNDT
ncbi:DUF805 domain-containing protein [Acinetobacter defluvii]|uniref:DUF805 domain-containing protein n=1 Tax=Acinetobacter defluvii TaxID=1871111 RepID=UPI00148FC69B